MQTLYQSLVTVNPVTLIAQILNLFLQMFLVKIFFLDKIKAVIDARREAADRQIADAQAARQEAVTIKETYENNMRNAKAEAEELIMKAQKTAQLRGEEIISQAKYVAAQTKSKAEADIELEKKKALNDAKNEISSIAMAIAGKVVGRTLNEDDQKDLVDNFIGGLGDSL